MTNTTRHTVHVSQTGVLTLSSVHFTLHTEPSVSPPEFTITCHTQGGPATTVTWKNENNSHLADNRDNETSQVIVDTSQNSVYENRLRVRGRESGLGYFCIIDNSLVQNVLGSVILTGVYSNVYVVCNPFIQLQESPPTSRPSSHSPTVHILLCLGSPQVILSLAM